MKRNFSVNLIWQPLAAIIYVALVLLVLSHTNSSQIIWAIGAGSLSSSSCIVFASPHNKSASTKNLCLGYLIGIGVGVLMHIALMKAAPLLSQTVLFHSNTFWALASIAVGLTIIAMIACDVFHPPAVGIALVLVLDIQHYGIIAVILLSAFILALLRYILNPYLKDLVL